MPNTFTFIPSYSSSSNIKPRTIRVDYGDGYVMRLQDGINNQKQMWDISFAAVPTPLKESILSFLSTEGGVSSFYWTPPGGTQKKFICEEWSYTNEAEELWSVRAKFEEVIE